MRSKIFFLSFSLIVLTIVESSYAIHLCDNIFSFQPYRYLLESDAQIALRKSWPNLFKSNKLLTYQHSSEKDELVFSTNSLQVLKTLSPQYLKAVEAYSEISPGYGGEYDNINGVLRRFIRNNSLTSKSINLGEYSHSLAQQIFAIDKAILSAPVLPLGLILFRGFTMEDSTQIKVGGFFKDHAFLSTSLEPRTAFDFARSSAEQTGDIPHLFIIEIKNNLTHGLHLVQNNEQEVLLQRNLTLKIQETSQRSMQISIRSGRSSQKTIKVPFRIVYATAGE